jgi:hypothetical protein
MSYNNKLVRMDRATSDSDAREAEASNAEAAKHNAEAARWNAEAEQWKALGKAAKAKWDSYGKIGKAMCGVAVAGITLAALYVKTKGD